MTSKQITALCCLSKYLLIKLLGTWSKYAASLWTLTSLKFNIAAMFAKLIFRMSKSAEMAVSSRTLCSIFRFSVLCKMVLWKQVSNSKMTRSWKLLTFQMMTKESSKITAFVMALSWIQALRRTTNITISSGALKSMIPGIR